MFEVLKRVAFVLSGCVARLFSSVTSVRSGPCVWLGQVVRFRTLAVASCVARSLWWLTPTTLFRIEGPDGLFIR